MTDFYDETLREIADLMNMHHYEQAEIIIERELSMPYVPADFEKKLHAFRKDLQFLTSENRERKERSFASLLEGLKGKPEDQLASASQLFDRNLRSASDELRKYLQGEPFPEAAALVIEAIAEQEVPEEFIFVRDGLEYTFWGDALTPAAESEGFIEAFRILKGILENDRPDYLEMCRKLLVHEVYMYLPLSYEKEEGEELADRILSDVSDMMDGGEVYREYKRNGN